MMKMQHQVAKDADGTMSFFLSLSLFVCVFALSTYRQVPLYSVSLSSIVLYLFHFFIVLHFFIIFILIHLLFPNSLNLFLHPPYYISHFFNVFILISYIYLSFSPLYFPTSFFLPNYLFPQYILLILLTYVSLYYPCTILSCPFSSSLGTFPLFICLFTYRLCPCLTLIVALPRNHLFLASLPTSF